MTNITFLQQTIVILASQLIPYQVLLFFVSLYVPPKASHIYLKVLLTGAFK